MAAGKTHLNYDMSNLSNHGRLFALRLDEIENFVYGVYVKASRTVSRCVETRWVQLVFVIVVRNESMESNRWSWEIDMGWVCFVFNYKLNLKIRGENVL